jgi:predicted negative regulator of RcsB-dependent stress response
MMDELDLARRAVRRSLLTEEQLSMAQAYASGGRSLLAVLLDLGYLRPQDVADLALQRLPPSPPRRSPLKTLGLLAVTAIATALISRSCSDERGFAQGRPLPRAVEEPSGPGVRGSEGPWAQVALRSSEAIRRAAAEQKRSGTISPKTELEVRHAAEVLSEAVAQGADGVPALTSLARARELLDDWEGAAAWYRRALAREELEESAHLGLARVLLALDRPLQALEHATAASTGEFAAEAFLVRAKADINLGNKEEARSNLDLALRRDPELRDRVRALEQRLDE